jgi:hypothetical protein
MHGRAGLGKVPSGTYHFSALDVGCSQFFDWFDERIPGGWIEWELKNGRTDSAVNSVLVQ